MIFIKGHRVAESGFQTGDKWHKINKIHHVFQLLKNYQLRAS
jgi:hypothetical protein